jgi:hypothetical protein
MHRRLSEYGYQLRRVFRRTDGRGKVKEETKTFEVIATKDHRLSRVKLEENGRAVSPEHLAGERLRAGQELEKAERASEQRAAAQAEGEYFTWRFDTNHRQPGGGDTIRVSVSEVLANCEFRAPRAGRLEDRDVLILSFRPRGDARFAEGMRYMSRAEGRVWIDLNDKVVIRMEVWPRGSPAAGVGGEAAPPAQGPAVVYQQVRVKEGIWLPAQVRIDSLNHPALFGAMRLDIDARASDYRRFAVEVKDAQVTPPR